MLYIQPPMRNQFLKAALSSPLSVLGILIASSVVMRFFSFFPSVIDHDESTYIVIADAVRQGQVYLRDVVDTKPVGIFILFASFQTLFGKSIFVLRVITAVWVGITAWVIYLIHRRFSPNGPLPESNFGPVASGLLYICMTSIFTFFGVSPNTELFFVLFTLVALYLILTHEGHGWFFMAGLMLGLGFMIKYVVLFDAVAFGLFFIWLSIRKKQPWFYWFSRCAVMVVGFAMPLTAVWMYYNRLGMHDTFMFFTFKLSGRYFLHPTWQAYLTFLLDGLLRYLPVTALFVFGLLRWKTTGKEVVVLCITWFVAVVMVILMPGKMFYHYFIQAMPPMCLIAGYFFDPARDYGIKARRFRKPVVVYTALSIVLLGNLLIQKHDYFDPPDEVKMTADYLNSVLQPGDIIYTGNSHQILYHLTGRKSPTPYVHSSLLWTVENANALGISREDEWNKILSQKPRFIIFGKPSKVRETFISKLGDTYREVKAIGVETHVFERSDGVM